MANRNFRRALLCGACTLSVAAWAGGEKGAYEEERKAEQGQWQQPQDQDAYGGASQGGQQPAEQETTGEGTSQGEPADQGAMGGASEEGQQPTEQGTTGSEGYEQPADQGATGGSSEEGQQPAEQGTTGEETYQGEQPADQPATGGSAELGQQPASVSGEVVDKKGSTLFLRLDEGAVLPVKVTGQTEFDESTFAMAEQGQKPKADKGAWKGPRALKHVSDGDTLAVQVESQGGENRATQISFEQGAGAQQAGAQQQPEQEQEIQGRIANVEGNWLNLEFQGALVPLRLDKQTSFESTGERQLSSAKELQPGDEVRASFKLEGGKINAAQTISLESNSQGQQQPEQPEQPEQQPTQ